MGGFDEKVNKNVSGYWVLEGTLYRPVDYNGDGMPDGVLIRNPECYQESVECLIPPLEKHLADAKEWMARTFTPKYRQRHSTLFIPAESFDLRKAANRYFLILQNAEEEREALERAEKRLGEVIGFSFGTGALASYGISALLSAVAAEFAIPVNIMRLGMGALALSGGGYLAYKSFEINDLDSRGLIGHDQALLMHAALISGGVGALLGGVAPRPKFNLITTTEPFKAPADFRFDPRLPNARWAESAAVYRGGGSGGGMGGGSWNNQPYSGGSVALVRAPIETPAQLPIETPTPSLRIVNSVEPQPVIEVQNIPRESLIILYPDIDEWERVLELRKHWLAFEELTVEERRLGLQSGTLTDRYLAENGLTLEDLFAFGNINGALGTVNSEDPSNSGSTGAVGPAEATEEDETEEPDDDALIDRLLDPTLTDSEFYTLLKAITDTKNDTLAQKIYEESSDRDLTGRLRALQAAALLGSREALAALIEMFRGVSNDIHRNYHNGESQSQITRIVGAMALIGDASFVPALKSAIEDYLENKIRFQDETHSILTNYLTTIANIFRKSGNRDALVTLVELSSSANYITNRTHAAMDMVVWAKALIDIRQPAVQSVIEEMLRQNSASAKELVEYYFGDDPVADEGISRIALTLLREHEDIDVKIWASQFITLSNAIAILSAALPKSVRPEDALELLKNYRRLRLHNLQEISATEIRYLVYFGKSGRSEGIRKIAGLTLKDVILYYVTAKKRNPDYGHALWDLYLSGFFRAGSIDGIPYMNDVYPLFGTNGDFPSFEP